MKIFRENSGSIFMTLCELAAGILLLINPAGFTSGIITAFGILLIVSGIIWIIGYFSADPEEAAKKQGLTKGLLSIMTGGFCACKSQWFIITFPLLTIIYGVITLVFGVTKIEMTIDLLRFENKNWKWCASGAALTILCSAIILYNPFSTTAVLWTFVAVSLIIEAIIDILGIIFSARHRKEEHELY